mgnify:CR=1 FL=1
MKKQHDKGGGVDRNARVAEEIHKAVAKFLSFNLRELETGLVTVTYVDVSSDYKSAKLFVTQLSKSNESIDKTLNYLNNHVREIKGYLARNLRLRAIPNLRFFHDESIQRGAHISSLIDNLSAKNRAELDNN